MIHDAPMLLFSGPCQIESLSHCLKMAETLKELVAERKNIRLVFKSSFDKANRTSLGSRRGVGLKRGLEILAEVKRLTDLPIVTDIHEPSQAALVAEVADVLQIPAFLCRQTDLLIAAGETNRVVHIKKGQFLSPTDMSYAVEKVASTGNRKILLCERGTCFGYRDLIVDFRGLLQMQELGWPVIFDATHSCMSMGGAFGKSGGSRRFALPYLKAALAVGCQGLFIECHEAPETAPSDGATMLPMSAVEVALKYVDHFQTLSRELVVEAEAMEPYQTAISNVMSEILNSLSVADKN